LLSALMLILGGAVSAAQFCGDRQVGEDMAPVILNNVFDKLGEQADDWFHRGDYKRSIQAFKMRIAYDPSDLQSYFLAAWLLWSSGDDAAAQEMYQSSVRAAPDSYEPYMEIGMHWSNRRDDRKAALWLFHACNRGAPVAAWKTLSHSYRRLGLLQDAIRIMREAKTMDPNDPTIDTNIQWLQEQIAPTGG
jgi:tetratricopeptide (TPR) repeat protein